MAFVKTTAQRKIAGLTKRLRIVSGGTSASKTYSILPMLITYAAKTPRLEISVVSESLPHLRRGAMRDFKKIMHDTNNWRHSGWNVSSSTYTFQNGSRIEFFGADQADKLRGARRDILFLNEANNISQESFNQLSMRTKMFIYIDFNPSHEFWAHTELADDPDAQWLTLTYKDNEATPQTIINELQKYEKKAETSEYWRNYVNVYVYGKLGTQQGVIFKEHQDWEQVAKIPARAELVGYGLDFGYTNDPSACIAVYYMDGAYFLDEVLYQTRMQNTDIANKLKVNGLDRVRGYADSAEPKSIDQILNEGVNITGVQKGQDSVRWGIGLMHDQIWYVSARSLNLIRELRRYSYNEQKNNRPNEPAKGQEDHAIDAARYFFMMHTGQPEQPFFVL